MTEKEKAALKEIEDFKGLIERKGLANEQIIRGGLYSLIENLGFEIDGDLKKKELNYGTES